MRTKSIKNLENIDPECPEWGPERRKEIDICWVRGLGCLLGRISAGPRASRVILNAPWCTKLRLQSFAFHVFSIVICHVPFCIGFCTILVWFPGSQNLENRVLVEAKHEFSQKLCFGGEHCFSSKSDPPKLPFQTSETCKIIEKWPSDHDRTNWLGKGPCLGQSVPENGIRITKYDDWPAISRPSRAHQKSFA